MILNLLKGSLEQGLIYSLVVMAVFLTSRVIRFDDLTVEGSFGTGGALASLLYMMGLPALLALPLALIGGGCCGAITASLHSHFKMNNLISGLVVSTALFSTSLRIAGSNMVLSEEANIFYGQSSLPILLGIVLIAWISLHFLLRSEIGLLIRSVGSNPQMITNLGKSITLYRTLILVIANALTALAGALFVHWCGFFSIMSNVGILIGGLAGLFLGESLRVGNIGTLILGAVIYQLLFSLTVELHLDPVWNNLIKACFIVGLVQLKTRKSTC